MSVYQRVQGILSPGWLRLPCANSRRDWQGFSGPAR